MQQQFEQIKAKVAECVAKANQLYSITLPNVQIRFDLKGRAAGIAMVRYGQYILRFNVNHIRLGGKSWEHLLNDTVPHEVAHLVCFHNPQLGRAHDYGWKRVCIALGGNGSRCYSEQDAPEAVAAQRPYVYTTTTGHKCPVSPIIHKKIQAGRTYTMRGGQGRLTNQCQYEFQGRVVAAKAPVVATPVLNLGGGAMVQVPLKRPAAAPAAGASKADLVRGRIAQAKARGENSGHVVQWAIEVLGMTRTLAQTYVRNNWNKV